MVPYEGGPSELDRFMEGIRTYGVYDRLLSSAAVGLHTFAASRAESNEVYLSIRWVR